MQAAWLTLPARVWNWLSLLSSLENVKINKRIFLIKNKNLRQSTLETSNIRPPPASVCWLPSSCSPVPDNQIQRRSVKDTMHKRLEESLKVRGSWISMKRAVELREELRGSGGRASPGEGSASAGRAPPLPSHAGPRPRDSRSPGSPLWPRGGRQGIHLNSSTSPTREARRKSRPAPRAPAAPPPPYSRGQDPKPLPPPPGAERAHGH